MPGYGWHASEQTVYTVYVALPSDHASASISCYWSLAMTFN